MKWSKEEKALSDSEFPHRIIIRLPKPLQMWRRGKSSTDRVTELLSPQSDVISWLMENVGHTARPPTTMLKLFSSNGITLKHNATAVWMVKTQGRESYKFYFRNAADAIAFKLMFAEHYGESQLN